MKRNFAYLIWSVVFFLFSGVLAAQGLTPKSPEVVRAVDKASAFLQQVGIREKRLGGRALIAMALVKSGVSEDHPFIERTIKEIGESVGSDGRVKISDHIYTAGIIILFLGELDPEKHQRELEAFGRYLHRSQRKDGAWTYMTAATADDYPSGDLSMTQYAVMALWTLNDLGFDVSGGSVNRVARWLMTVQDPTGAYAYQSKVSSDFKTVSREGIRLSMATAGMASVYVCRDLFGYNLDVSTPDSEKVHEAFSAKPSDDEPGLAGFRFTVPDSSFRAAQRRGDAWLEKHSSPISLSTEYFFYYLYAYERYAAFRELAENRFFESPPWYHKTAEFLLSHQAGNGSWTGNLTAEIDTAYGVLFLTRSTRRTFEKGRRRFSGANLLGGRGLPRMTDDVKVEDGQVVSPSEITDPDQLLQRLADLENTDEEDLARLAELPAGDIEAMLHKNKVEVKKLVGHESADKRHLAVTLLGKSGDISYAPALVYALTDPDPSVAQAALDALLRLARDPTAEVFPAAEDAESQRQREKIIQRWKTWYLRIDPDAVFEER